MPELLTTRNLLRSELREVFGDRPRLIKAFENLFADVSTTIPEVISGNSDEAAEVSDVAQGALSAAARAEDVAGRALDIASAAAEGPPMLVSLPLEADDVTSIVMALVARVARLEIELANLREGPTP